MQAEFTNPRTAGHAHVDVQRRASFDRRSFLRGLGVCVALPALESLAPARG